MKDKTNLLWQDARSQLSEREFDTPIVCSKLKLDRDQIVGRRHVGYSLLMIKAARLMKGEIGEVSLDDDDERSGVNEHWKLK